MVEQKTYVDHKTLVGQAFLICLAMTGFSLILHFIISTKNEILFTTNPAGTKYFLTLQLGDVVLPWALGLVLIADTVAFSLALVGLYRHDGADEHLATKVVTTYLWVIVTGIVVSILWGILPPADAFRRELTSKIVPLVPFIAVKEWLFRQFHSVYEKTGRLMFEALAWNCRKDGLFNGFFLIAVLSGLIGFTPSKVHYLLLFGKLYLLGSATLAITRHLRVSYWPH